MSKFCGRVFLYGLNCYFHRSYAPGQEEGEGPRRREGALRGECGTIDLFAEAIASGADVGLHRRNGVDGRQVLPALVAVADAREELPRGTDRGSVGRPRELVILFSLCWVLLNGEQRKRGGSGKLSRRKSRIFYI